MKPIILSYTTISDLHEASHTWVNKTLGIEKPKSEAMEKGSAAHERLQNHVRGIAIIENLDLPMTFPTVEYHARKPYTKKYTFHGYLDGINFASKSALEIKTSGKKLWSQADFKKSPQPRYYSWVTGIRDFYFITCHFDLSGLLVYKTTFTDEDWQEAEQWAKDGIAIIESGDYTGGLDENGRCIGCSYGENCFYL